jgi:hypothetical protein
MCPISEGVHVGCCVSVYARVCRLEMRLFRVCMCGERACASVVVWLCVEIICTDRYTRALTRRLTHTRTRTPTHTNTYAHSHADTHSLTHAHTLTRTLTRTQRDTRLPTLVPPGIPILSRTSSSMTAGERCGICLEPWCMVSSCLCDGDCVADEGKISMHCCDKALHKVCLDRWIVERLGT